MTKRENDDNYKEQVIDAIDNEKCKQEDVNAAEVYNGDTEQIMLQI